MTLSAGTIAIEVTFDVDQRGSQTWDIVIETDGGTLTLSAGASKMAVDGAAVTVTDDPEYARLYRRFHHLVTTRTSDVDFSPFRLRSEEHTSELQSLMRISYAVFCLKKKTQTHITRHRDSNH